MNDLEKCPSCLNNLPARLKSGRVVCLKCGWTDQPKKMMTETVQKSDELDVLEIVNAEKVKETLKESKLKSEISYELVRVSNYLLLGILGIMLYGHFKRPFYEYEIVAPSDLTFNESMNKYGEQGWKPVNCRRATSSDESTSASYECILMREK